MNLPALDILIYAHDGRGLGHASRSTAIGMALRRLFPEKRVLFISGCKFTASLIGQAPLDWIKLPAYETKVIEGKSKGIPGNSNFGLKELGRYRAETLRQIVSTYRPRIVLVDHQPQGKQKELLPAIHDRQSRNTRWVLGVRGIVGGVPQVHSQISQTTFHDRFDALLWYGDPRILGEAPMAMLSDHFSTTPQAMGYVSRMAEFVRWQPATSDAAHHYGGTVSIPWIGENTLAAIPVLAETLRRIGPDHGHWRLFIGCKDRREEVLVADHFKDLPHCTVEPPSDRYSEALHHSTFAVIYGGYNSIIDILQMKKPAVVLMRGMQDREQEQHLQRLNEEGHAGLAVFAETELAAEGLSDAIRRGLSDTAAQRHTINLNGAENTARWLVSMID